MQSWYSSILFVAFTCNTLLVIECGETSRREYLELLEHSPKLVSLQGNHAEGEIQVVVDPQEMAAIEKASSREVGILMRDNYWIWVNDACIFPNGKTGVYGRILWVKSLEDSAGVAVMPLTPEGKVILNCNFRHATRSWEIELPRGLVNAGETLEVAAKRETFEETGMLVSDLVLLGELPPDSGLTNSIVPIFLTKVIGKTEAQPTDSEAIEEILFLSISEIKQAFLRGHYEQNIRGVKKQIHFRDPFLAYAILMYELKNNSSFQ